MRTATAIAEDRDARPVASKEQNRQALRIIARSLFRELKGSGYGAPEIVSFSTELLSLLASDLTAPAANGEAI